jgi:hypothetical protein
MSLTKAKLALACGLTAIGVAACGTTTKPLAGSPGVASAPGTHAKIDDPRTNVNNHVACIRSDHIPVVEVGQTNLQIGSPPGGPFVHFAPTAGMAQGDQISGLAKFQGAEVIGSALLWPNQGSGSVLGAVESCLAQGVSG